MSFFSHIVFEHESDTDCFPNYTITKVQPEISISTHKSTCIMNPRHFLFFFYYQACSIC